MGNPAPSANAPSLRQLLIGVHRFEQHPIAYQWATEQNRIVDMFGDFARERHLRLFQSGNESENWIDTFLGVVYKMNTLVHVGGDIAKLFERVDLYNTLFPETALRFIGFHVMSPTNVYPVFTQPFIDNARFATVSEILSYMKLRGFCPTEHDGSYSNGQVILSDIKPKNVLQSTEGITFVIDADVQRVQH